MSYGDKYHLRTTEKPFYMNPSGNQEKDMFSYYIFEEQDRMIEQLSNGDKSQWLRQNLWHLLLGRYGDQVQLTREAVETVLETLYEHSTDPETREAVCTLQDAVETGGVEL